MFLATLVVLGHTSRIWLAHWAVFVFFILSGYWIAKIYAEDYEETRSPILTFYASRYLRLAPAFIACVAIDLVVLFALGEERDAILAALRDPAWILHNVFIAGCSYQQVFLPMTWSLDIEIQFYLCAPLFLFLAHRYRSWLPLVAVALLPVSLTMIPRTADEEVGTLFRYLCFFCAGVGIYVLDWRPTTRQGILSLATFFAIYGILLLFPVGRLILLSGQHPDPLHRYCMPFSILGALMVVQYLAVSVRTPSSSWDRHLGNLSYEVYLFHLIPVTIMWHYAGHLPGIQRLPSVVLAWIGTYLGALLLYRFVGQPFERLRRRFVKSRRPVRATEPLGMSLVTDRGSLN